MKTTGAPLDRRTGIALVTVLAILVLITAAVLAFYTHATSNLVVESSHTQRTKAVMLNRSAGDYVSGLILQEIVDSNNSIVTSTNGATYYIPKSGTNAIPQRKINTALLSDTNACTLVRQSISSADPNASADSSGTAAKNGRVVNASRWNKPQLISGSTGFAQADQLPNWVYVSGTSGVTGTASQSATVGRFAYNVYEVDGLLNVNAAGYNPTTGLTAEQIVSLKATQAGADLTLLGLQSAAVGNLIEFRNPGITGSNYISATQVNALDGFISSCVTGTGGPLNQRFFTSRQDLIRYATSKDTSFASALPYLTHFSRSINAPSACAVDVASATTVNPLLAGVRFPDSGTYIHYADDGSSSDVSFKTGDALLQRRFSLAKLGWITCKGPSAELLPSDTFYNAGGTKEHIQACFGLTWDGGNARWNYTGTETDITKVQEIIKTLDTVASEHREPNFFELLKAGIAAGSLGVASTASNPLSGQISGSDPEVQPTLDKCKDLHILKIGANIIDCADSDNYPTILYFSPGGWNVEVAGVEDLPYLHGTDGLVLNSCSAAVGGTRTYTAVDLVCTPVFFNPHSTASGTSAAGPSSIKAKVLHGTLTWVKFLGKQYQNANNFVNTDLTGQSITVPASSFRNLPGVMTGANDAQSLGTLVPYSTGNRDVLTFRCFSYPYHLKNPPASIANDDGSGPLQLLVHYANLGIALRYTPPVGPEKTYATLGSYDDGDNPPGIDMGTTYETYNNLYANRKDLAGTVYYDILWDPRTARLGPSQGWARSSAINPTPDPVNDRIRNRDPFNWLSNAANIHWGQWPQGGKVGGYDKAPAQDYLNARDPDTITRPADGWLGDGANLYRGLSDQQRRPVILQRAYKNVAELGYVFRDCPWKTLSFFDETSGDGALLDLFSVTDEPAVTAGRVNINTAPGVVRESLISGMMQGSDMTDAYTPGDVTKLAAAYKTALDSGGVTPTSVADLPKAMSSTQLGSALPDIIKYRREAFVRALANSAQTRTWNFLIDSVAQSGRFVGTPIPEHFMVEGESRCWLSIAIDRYTGEVVSRQWEWVTE